MSKKAEIKNWRDLAPYLAVAVLGLLFGSLLMQVFTGDPNKPGVVWEPYSEAAFKAALEQKKPIMIYFAADWCGPCHLLRKETFTDLDVRAEAERFARFKVDVTNEDPAAVAVQVKYMAGVLPTVVFINSEGSERVRLRLMGFEEAARFRQRMQAVK